MKTVGLDIGTTSICAAVWERGKLVESRNKSNASHITGQPWEALQDPARIRAVCEALLCDLITRYPDIAGIGVTGQMHGILYVDAGGAAVSPLYSWQDGRGNLRENGAAFVEWLREKSGYALSTGFGLVTHAWLARHGQLPTDAASLCTIPDYIALGLTGGASPRIHPSMAASLGFYDPEAGDSDRKALEKLEIPTGLLPVVDASEAPLGAWRGIPVFPAIGDNQASVFGSVEGAAGILVNVGTGGQLSAVCNRRDAGCTLEYRPYLGGKWLAVGASLSGGDAYGALYRFYAKALAMFGYTMPEDGYARMEAAAQYPTTLAADTRFRGSREAPEVTGSLTGLTMETFTPGDLNAAILTGVCRELYGFYNRLPEDCRSLPLYGSGNGLRKNALLRRIAEEMFGKPLTMAACAEEAAFGAAKFAAERL